MIGDTPVFNNVTDVGTFSGGGANGIWSWSVAMELKSRGYEMEMVGGSSTGCIVAFLYAKEFYEEADKLYRLTYEQGSRNIFEPGIAAIKKGKIDINWLKAIPAVFRIKKVKSLMTNKGLYETFLKLEKMKPGFAKPMFFNTTSLAAGKGYQHSSEDFKGNPEALAMALTASTSMPGILPWWDVNGFKTLVDGGTTDGLPFSQMFARMEPGRDYQFWNIMCNPIDLLPANELTNAAQILGRSAIVMLNKSMVSELNRTNDKNNVAKVIWPATEEIDKIALELQGEERGKLLAISDTLRKFLGYRYMPIHNLIYSGNRGVFEFTMESYEDQIQTAKRDVEAFLKANQL